MSDPYSSEALVDKYLATEKPLPDFEFSFLATFLKKSMKICDIGFGSGGVLSQLQENGYPHLYGIDSSRLFVQHAQVRFGQSIEIIHLDLAKQHGIVLSFDGIIAYHFLTAIQEEKSRSRTLDIVCEMVRSDGILITKSFLSSTDKTVDSHQVGVDLKIWIPSNQVFREEVCSRGFQLVDSVTVDRDGFSQIVNVFKKAKPKNKLSQFSESKGK